jgi:hypothetical protein
VNTRNPFALDADEDAALIAWGISERFPHWPEGRRRQLVELSERFRRQRRRWQWQDGHELCEGVALALDAGQPITRLKEAVSALATKATAITVESVDGFIATACQPRGRTRL